jgi:nitrite reductase (NADH) large subunit
VPPIEGLNHPAVFVLRRADDAVGIRAYAQRHRSRRAIVVGGGLLGLEAAHALHTFGLRPTVVQRSSRLLLGQFDERAAGLIQHYLTGLGVHLVLGVTPAAVVEQDGGLALTLSDGSAMATDIVVLCTGIRPNVDLAVTAGLDVDRGVLVDDGMQTSDPHIYAAGDIVQHRSEIPGLWPIAVEQAEVAAANVTGDKKTYTPRPQVTILKGIGLSATAIGDVDGRNGDEILIHEPPPDEVRYLKLVIRNGILAGAVLLGDWTEATSIVDAVTSRRNVSTMLPALRTGDMSPLG